ncbi:MAG: PP2C family protein-serine/threonine phosphatase [Vulcanimicrobiaceae bacterium]
MAVNVVKHAVGVPRRTVRIAICHEYRQPFDADLAGGNFVAFDRHDDGSTSLLMGDVSARGDEGVEIASRLALAFHVACSLMSRPSRMLEKLNIFLLETLADSGRDLFANAFACRFRSDVAYMMFASAGAPPPILVTAPATQRMLPAGGVVLGGETKPAYNDVIVPFGDGSALVAFTDGIPKSFDSLALGRRLGISAVAQAVRSALGRHRALNCHQVFSEIDNRNSGLYGDDATLLVASARAFDNTRVVERGS